MSILKKKYICPFCFESNQLSSIRFRCRNGPSKCPHCKKDSRTRICGACHSELPYAIGEYKDMILSVIGAKEAGKSHYIAVLINAISNEIGASFNANLQPLNDETMTRYRDEFYKPIFSKKRTIEVTRSARADKSVRSPLIYTLSFAKKGLLGGQRTRDIATISFFDTAGEDLTAEDIMRTENKYIYNSAGIILLLDPLQIDYVRDKLQGKVELPLQNTESDEILIRTTNFIRKARSIPQDKLIEIPLALAFTKCDALADLLPAQSALNYQSRHNGFFDFGDFDAINGEMQALVSKWAGKNLLNQLKLNFKHYGFFGLTALGCNPGASQKITSVRPMRVADPFLWLLNKNKLIPCKEHGK